MSRTAHQDLLLQVERPSRYLGNETNAVVKNHRAVDLRIALAFPDLYEIGTSHFGLQILYDILNRRPDVLAERVFTPAVDMEKRLRSRNLPLTTLESGKPLADFDIIGFSLLYELNYTNILTMLALSNLPFYASQRTASDPLIIAGGPCTGNPEPVADFFDAMVIGDGEQVIAAMADVWIRTVNQFGKDRSALLRRWSRIQGVYVPQLFEPVNRKSGFQILQSCGAAELPVRKAVVPDLEQVSFPDEPVVPHGRPVHDRLRIEIARGCTRGCRFCQAGMIYRPVRERSPETLLQLSKKSLQATGYADLSLLSLSTGDYSGIDSLMSALMARCAADHVAVSLPSLRAGTLSPEMMALVKQVRKTGFTIAPEAGSQRLRDVINKNVSETEIQDTVRNAFAMGWKVIKLYFMIGLPTETDDDLQAIVDLVGRLRLLAGKKVKDRKIHVSAATFIPKPHTPFQWEPQIALDEARRRMGWLREQLAMPGIQFKWQDPRVSWLEGLWARGDRRLARLLATAWELGCRFDGWSDHFDFGRWQTALNQTGVEPQYYLTRKRQVTEPLPWDHIDTGVTKEFLRRERSRAFDGHATADCRTGDCNRCGVCDFRQLAPILAHDRVSAHRRPQGPPAGPREDSSAQRLQIRFHKTERARFFGHLEMVNLFQRALRRSDIHLAHTRGYHPKPKISFQDALPLGMESVEETAVLTLSSPVACTELMARLNRQLPEGLTVVECRPAGSRTHTANGMMVSYRVELEEAVEAAAIRRFLSRPHCVIAKVNRKGRTTRTDVRAAVADIQQVQPAVLEVHLRSASGKILRPYDALVHGLSLNADLVGRARIRKTAVETLR